MRIFFPPAAQALATVVPHLRMIAEAAAAIGWTGEALQHTLFPIALMNNVFGDDLLDAIRVSAACTFGEMRLLNAETGLTVEDMGETEKAQSRKARLDGCRRWREAKDPAYLAPTTGQGMHARDLREEEKRM